MASYRELLNQVKAEITEIDATEGSRLLEAGDHVWLDVREQGEWDEGIIPGAVHIPRGNLESRVEGLLPDRDQAIVVYCAVGSRSAFAAKTLEELGYTDVVNLAGGYTDWKRNGYPPAARARSPRSSAAGTRATSSSRRSARRASSSSSTRKILLIGAGGLGSPSSLYLAAAGVGTLGIVDDDTVDETNLQRQIVHSTERLGDSKAESAKRTLEALNPDVTVKTVPGAPHLRERRPHPRRGLGRDRRRRRQLPDALPR